MRLNLDEIHYRIRTDNKFKKRLRNIVLIGGAGIMLIAVLGVIGTCFLLFGNNWFLILKCTGLFTRLGFNYVRDFASSFMLEDLTAILTPLTGETNVNEMKNLVTQYFNQLSNNPAIDFQNFQNFITTVKNSLMDNQISNTELELVRKFLLN